MGFGLERPSVSSATKWLGFVTAIWVQAISGNNYTFSNYSDALKTLMNLTQLELNNLSVAKDVGKAFGLLAGLASDRFPTWLLLLIGSVEGLLGYGAQWLVVSERIKPLSYWQMCIFLCMGGNSTTWMNTAILVTCIRNFRSNRGPVSGILKGYVGLSTAIFTDLCAALFNDNSASFLLMLAVTPFAVCLTAMVFLSETAPSASADEDKQESRYLWFFNGLAVFVALYLLAYDFVPDPSELFSLIFSAILLLLLASPLVVPAYSFYTAWVSQRVGSSDPETPVLDEPLLRQEVVPATQHKAEFPSDTDDVAVERKTPVIGEEHTIFETMRTLDFWILFVSFLCGVGTGLAVMNNLGQIGLALGYADVSIFVSLTSIWGFFGRIVSGLVSEYFIRKAAIPRPLWNAASQILMAVGYILLATAVPGSLYIGSIVVGICYGIRLAITVPTASELFGLKYYGLIYNVLILNLPLGSLLFSGLLAGFLYDTEATPTAGGGNTCAEMSKSSSTLYELLTQLSEPISESLSKTQYTPSQSTNVSLKAVLEPLLPRKHSNPKIDEAHLRASIRDFTLACALLSSSQSSTHELLTWIPKHLPAAADLAFHRFSKAYSVHSEKNDEKFAELGFNFDSVPEEKRLVVELMREVLPLLKDRVKESSIDKSEDGDEVSAASARVPVGFAIVAAYQFRWFVTQIDYSRLGKLCALAVPCALTALDHWSPEIKGQGMMSFIHITKNVDAAELVWCQDVILDACCQNIASSDEIWHLVVEMSVLVVTRTQQSNPRSAWFDRILNEMLSHLERQPRNKERRVAWLRHVEPLFNGVGLVLLAHLRHIFPLFFKWMHADDDETVLLVLKQIETVIKLTWIRNTPYVERLVDELATLHKEAALKRSREEIRNLVVRILILLHQCKGLQFEAAWGKHRDDPNLATIPPSLSDRRSTMAVQ